MTPRESRDRPASATPEPDRPSRESRPREMRLESRAASMSHVMPYPWPYPVRMPSFRVGRALVAARARNS